MVKTNNKTNEFSVGCSAAHNINIERATTPLAVIYKTLIT